MIKLVTFLTLVAALLASLAVWTLLNGPQPDRIDCNGHAPAFVTKTQVWCWNKDMGINDLQPGASYATPAPAQS